MSIPTNRDELRNRSLNGEQFTYLFFYGHSAPEHGIDTSCFSQWFLRPFVIDGITYPTAEHWMMAQKARLFNDVKILQLILKATTPKEAKALGRKVRNFDAAIWDEHKFEIVCRGNYEKFKQNPDLMEFLLSTMTYQASDPRESTVVQEEPTAYNGIRSVQPDVILVEAAGRDVIWGIGLGQNNPKAKDPMTWRGKNLLGFALTIVRQRIAEEST